MAQTKINGGTQIAAASIPLSALVSGYSVPTANLAQGSLFIQSGGSVSMTANLNLGGFKATNSAVPTAASDLTTKAYVDALLNGFTIHGARVVATANSALTGLLTIDGYTLIAGDIVLLTAQSTPSQNGPWVAASGAWTRPTWWAGAAVIPEGNYFLVDPDGTTFKNTKWFVITAGSITVDTTSITFSQDLSGTSYTNGTGLTLTGNVFSVNYGTTSTTATVGNDSRVTGALQTSALGTGVQTALGVNVGTAGSVLVNGGALGTPSSGTLTSVSGLPVSTGIAGLGTGVATALAINAGTGAGFALLASGVLTAAEFPILAGDVTSAGGTLTTAVNHTSGSGFVKYTDWVWNETPAGTINGSNVTFTLANTPANSSTALILTQNGNILDVGAGNDFTISGLTITMLNAPQSTPALDKLRCTYLK